jgi:UDP-N-acetylglucosamine 4,6-dehydratase
MSKIVENLTTKNKLFYRLTVIPYNVCITGGTGSLGNALTDLLLPRREINKIIIFSRDEQKQDQMRRKYESNKYFDKLRFYLGDVRDEARLKFAFHDVEVVIHAAALKIVPALETDPLEAVKTNINGTQNVITAAIDQKVKKVMLVSTDKAVSPENLYGATKLCAEKLMLAANNYKGRGGPIFAVTRYGNVTNSRGSVIPLFLEQLKAKKPFTITDPHMTRFWITLEDAAKFVWHAVCNIDATNRRLVIPIMPAYNIVDLAKAISPKHKRTIIGIRSGEKIHEYICTNAEANSNAFGEIYRSSYTTTRMTIPEIRKHLRKQGLIK